MPRSRVQMRTSTTIKVPEDKIAEILFANQFILADPAKSYVGVKFALQHDQTHTTPHVGKHIFSTECPVTANFLRLLEWYPGKDKMELQAVYVVETGLSFRDAKIHEFEKTDENMLRILINLREEATSHVGLGIIINPKKDQTITCWLDMQQSFATVLPGTISALSFISGNGDIPGKRRQNGKSIYVIMDIIPKQDTQYATADMVVKHTNVKQAQFIEQLKKMHKDGKLPTDKFEEMMKDPQSAFMKMVAEESGQKAEAAESSETTSPLKEDNSSMDHPSQSVAHLDTTQEDIDIKKETTTTSAHGPTLVRDDIVVAASEDIVDGQ